MKKIPVSADLLWEDRECFDIHQVQGYIMYDMNDSPEPRRRSIGREIAGLLCFLLALLLLVSLASFRVGDTPLFGQTPSGPAKNWIGLIGAWISALLFWVFGKAAFITVFWTALAGWNLFRQPGPGRSAVTLTAAGFLLPVLSIFLALFSQQVESSHKFGGAVGFYLAKLLLPLTGKLGLILILIFLLLVCVIVVFGISISSLKGKFGRGKPSGGGRGKGHRFDDDDEDDLPPPRKTADHDDDFLDDDPPPRKKTAETAGKDDHSAEDPTEPDFNEIRPVRPPLIERVRYVMGHDDTDDGPAAIPADDGEDPLSAEDVPETATVDGAAFAEDAPEASPKKKRKRSAGLPSLSLLHTSERVDPQRFSRDIKQTSQMLEEVLKDFGIESKVVHTEVGPSITRYELKVASGIRLNRITGLADNIALSLAGQKVRVIAPIPGKAAVGIEVPNRERSMVTLGDLLVRFKGRKKRILDFPLGLDISGQPVFLNLTEAPHLLIAGSTGAGKSVCLNTIICSFLYACTPEEVRFIMVDPKMVELKLYNGIEHLLTDVITNPRKASLALRWLVNEMERRYQMMDQASARDIVRYNDKADGSGRVRMPYIVLIVDELADLMMVAQKDVEESIARLAQKARAVGIHLILATQRPSVDVITGIIKANFPSRVAFQVASKIDSRTILDQNGAEQLLRKGDLLLSFAGSAELVRVQGAYISDDELSSVAERLKDGAELDYNPDIVSEEERAAEEEGGDMNDGVFRQAVEIVRATRKASASYLQRKLQIGYNRAARYIDLMEQQGLVGPQNGSKPREVYL
jgi:S-DNA-T family DNA segregation ATPase FtsK/SpoIIIE